MHCNAIKDGKKLEKNLPQLGDLMAPLNVVG
jgi:hypothetical protein